jgi:hypothetical protein
VTRELFTQTIPTDKRAAPAADDEPGPGALAAFNEFLDALGSLTRDELAVAAHAARQMAEDSERREERQRKPRLKTVLDQAKKAGAKSATVDGITYTLSGQAEQQSDTDRELAAFGARHGIA